MNLNNLFCVSCLFIILVHINRSDAQEPVLVLNDTNEPPFTTPQHNGFLDIIAGEAFRRLGMRLMLIKHPAERGLINANAGIDDGDLTRIVGLEKIYPNLIRVPEKLIDWEFVGYTKNNDIESSWSTIGKHVVGYITGWKIYEQHLQGIDRRVAANTPEQLFHLLAHDRIEVALYARYMGRAYIQQLGLHGIKQLSPPLATREMFIYLHKRHSDLVPKLQNVLKDLKSEGIYRKIQEQTLLPYSEIEFR